MQAQFTDNIYCDSWQTSQQVQPPVWQEFNHSFLRFSYHISWYTYENFLDLKHNKISVNAQQTFGVLTQISSEIFLVTCKDLDVIHLSHNSLFYGSMSFRSVGRSMTNTLLCTTLSIPLIVNHPFYCLLYMNIPLCLIINTCFPMFVFGLQYLLNFHSSSFDYHVIYSLYHHWLITLLSVLLSIVHVFCYYFFYHLCVLLFFVLLSCISCCVIVILSGCVSCLR